MCNGRAQDEEVEDDRLQCEVAEPDCDCTFVYDTIKSDRLRANLDRRRFAMRLGCRLSIRIRGLVNQFGLMAASSTSDMKIDLALHDSPSLELDSVHATCTYADRDFTIKDRVSFRSLTGTIDQGSASPRYAV